MSPNLSRRWFYRPAMVPLLVGTLAIGLGACGDDPAPTATPGSVGSSSAISITASPSPTPTRSAPGAGPTATPSGPTAPRSAQAQLAGFLAGARQADTRLHRAASLINAGITAKAVRVDPATVQAVKRVSPTALARTIPAGTERPLLQALLLVYSEISSRRMAMDPITHAGDGVVVLPRPGPTAASPSAQEILDALKNGTAAQSRFEADLVKVRALARSSARFPVAGPRSRAAAELAVRLLHIDGANGGCGGTGGEVFPRLATLTWKDGVEGHWWSGTVGGVQFRAEYRGTWWRVHLNAC